MPMDIEYISPGELIPYGKNAKRHPSSQVKMIAESIRQFGFRQPIVVDGDNVVIIGHGRLLAENCFLSTKKEEHYALCL